jgi:hypothetical protein
VQRHKLDAAPAQLVSEGSHRHERDDSHAVAALHEELGKIGDLNLSAAVVHSVDDKQDAHR